MMVSVRYTNGIVGKKPNPRHEPGKKVSKTLPVFDQEGVSLSISFYTGRWPGGAASPPNNQIGRLKYLRALKVPVLRN